MKLKASLIKVISVALLTAVLVVSFVPTDYVRASGFTIDDSVFSSYDVEKLTVWYWREGIPPTENNGTQYPVLITWDNGKYYFLTEQEFFNIEKQYTNLRTAHGDLTVLSYDNPDLNITCDNGVYPQRWIGSGGWVGEMLSYPQGFTPGYYRYVCHFPTPEKGTTAKLPFSFADLVSQGRMISFEKINVPFVVGAGGNVDGVHENNFFRLGVEVPSNLQNNNRYYNKNYKYAWMMLHFAFDEYDNRRGNDNVLMGNVKDYYNCYFKPYFTNSLTNFDSCYDPAADELTVTVPETLYWNFYRVRSGNGKYPNGAYSIFTQADWSWNIEDDAVWDDVNKAMAAIAQVGGASIHSRLDWSGSVMRTQANRNAADQNANRQQFKIYYATPVIMDVIQTGFTVEKGQVANLDGPILIGNNCTITVKEGGTLTITAKSEANGVDLGWVMNNGKIVVERGGTLYVQKGACLNKYNNKNNAGGGVICRGLCIVDEDAKLCGGGVDGLQFLNGSHVVNYGAIISENFKVEKDHTIENRGSNAVVFHGKGNGVTGSGYGLFVGTVTSGGYPERGTVLNTVEDSVASNGIYTW